MDGVKCSFCTYTNEAGRSTCEKCGARLPLTESGTPAASGEEGPEAKARAAVLRRGQVVANRYTVQSILGRGGMGRIYKVHDNTLNEVVALKMLLPELIQDQEVVERFFNEARIARGLSHPNIGRVHDIGVEGSNIYISMEYVAGKSLRELLMELPPGERFSMKTILRIFDELGSALEYAHQFTVHRDLKPENLMLDPEGNVKLMDFGISKLMSNPGYTSASLILGTPHYMSPEQLRSSADVDARADIFSLGVMLYETLTGYTPTGIAKPPSQVTQEIPRAIDAVIQKCLEPNPNDRFQNVAEFRAAINEIMATLDGTDGDEAAPPPAIEPRAVSAGPKAVAWGLLVLIVAAWAGGIFKAEAWRQAAFTGEAVGVPSRVRSTEPGSGEVFAALASVVERARIAAKNAARSAEPARAKWANAWLLDAEAWWDGALAEVETRPAMAIDSGWDALHRYLAVCLEPEGMMYVPPGEATLVARGGEMSTVALQGFFIDEKPVDPAAFSRFCQNGEFWRWPPDQAQGLLMGYVTYYDAQAFAASQSPPKKLPTAPQWTRAVEAAKAQGALLPLGRALAPEPADEDEDGEPGTDDASEAFGGTLYLLDGVWEWTRSISMPFPYRREDGREDEARPTFETRMTAVSGGFDERGEYSAGPLAETPFESRWPAVGFRCVYELPTDLDAVLDLLK